jgi:hypothetical protein
MLAPASGRGGEQPFKTIEFKVASRHVLPNSSIGAVRLSRLIMPKLDG